jgi:glycosyltransferase involved in cell wall biosynthesis
MNRKAIKVLFYTDTPLYGGAEKQLLLLAKNLHREKFIPFIAGRNSEALQDWYKEMDRENLEYSILKTASKNSPDNYFRLSSLIRSVRPDLIHAHIWNPVACKFAFLAALRWRIPLIITEHDPFELSGYKKLYKKIALKIPRKIITVSHANRQLMARLYPRMENKIITVHNGIEAVSKKLSELEINSIKKNVFQAGAQTRIIFSAGTLHQRKGYKYLISAFQKIAGKFDNIKLVIAGSGPEENHLRQLIKNLNLEKKVVLLGQRKDVDLLMQASDLFVLPSLKEAFGLVILEAMQNGLPVIASGVGGIPEIISNEQLGILVKPANKNELIKAITKVLSKDEFRRELIKNGLIHWQNFSAARMARDTENVYLETLNPPTLDSRS